MSALDRFTVTYEIVTPGSAEDGDAVEIGYIHPNGGLDELATVKCANDYAMSLRSALQHCSPVFDCGRWFASNVSTLSFQTGADISTCLHPPANVTPSSYARIKRLIGAT